MIQAKSDEVTTQDDGCDCLDLKERFDSKYRVATEESYFAESGSTTNSNTDPWNWILRGSRGHVCPWGGDLLAVCMDEGHVPLCNRLMKEPWVIQEKSQRGDDGVNAVFHVDHIEAAARYAKLYERWYLSDERREQAIERLRDCSQSPVDGPSSDAERDPIANATNPSDCGRADA
ncbi:MAG: hypothetical protein ABGZ35_11125 [Planctomycetaceae bacterium]